MNNNNNDTNYIFVGWQIIQVFVANKLAHINLPFTSGWRDRPHHGSVISQGTFYFSVFRQTESERATVHVWGGVRVVQGIYHSQILSTSPNEMPDCPVQRAPAPRVAAKHAGASFKTAISKSYRSLTLRNPKSYSWVRATAYPKPLAYRCYMVVALMKEAARL